ncbi:MAG: VOC family protein [Acidobacteriota bacterium]|nr:VOC family protein [Acidobacteriota bacterium]
MKKKATAAPVTLRHFAINADDVGRARRFYERVFGWTFQPWGPPEFFMVETGAGHAGTGEAGGIRGSLQRRRELAPGLVLHGFECSFAIDDVPKVVAAVRAGGGRILMEPTILPGIGELIFFQDTEGNVVGAMRYDETVD